MRTLIIAPHPDDEVLGCGGTIPKHIKMGHKVYICFVTKAYTPDWSEKYIMARKEEIQNVKKILDIEETYHLEYPTVKLDTIPQKELNDSLAGIMAEVRPDILYIPWKGDLNKDHRLVFEASLVAARPLNHKHRIKKILSYETLSETEWGRPIEIFVPNVYVDISDTFDIKVKAMEAYRKELKESPHPRSIEIIEALAKKRGSEIGVRYAESFHLIRETI